MIIDKRAILDKTTQELGYRVQLTPIVRQIQTFQPGKLQDLKLLAWNPVSDSPCTVDVTIPDSRTRQPVISSAPDYKGTRNTKSVSMSFIPSEETQTLSISTKDLGCIIDEVSVTPLGPVVDWDEFSPVTTRSITVAPSEYANSSSKYGPVGNSISSSIAKPSNAVTGPPISFEVVSFSVSAGILLIAVLALAYCCVRRRSMRRDVEENNMAEKACDSRGEQREAYGVSSEIQAPSPLKHLESVK
jgi:hypothetical protein